MEGLSDQDRWEGNVGVGRYLRFVGRGLGGEDACITVDGGALVANDCGAFGFTKISPFLPIGKNSKGE